MLFHVLYGKNTEMVVEFIYASSCRLYGITKNEELRSTVYRVMELKDRVGDDRLRAMFFLLFNVDMQLKEYVCDVGNESLYSAALNLESIDSRPRHSYSMVGTRCICPRKAEGFMRNLKPVIDHWLSNEALNCSDLITKIKEEYLVS